MTHIIEQGQYFLFRTKDIHSKGLVCDFDFPDEKSFNITIKVTLVRIHSKKIIATDGYKRFVDKVDSFDFVKYGSNDTYGLSFRVIRFPLSNSSECIVTNPPTDKSPPEQIKKCYYTRWE